MQDRNDLKGASGIRRLKNAVVYSFAGYKAAWRDEEAFRQICYVSGLTVPSALYFGNTFAEKILLLLPSVLCVLVELLNSAIENVVDRVSLEKHPLSKKAKDMGSAAQLTAQCFLVFVWLCFFLKEYARGPV